MLLEGLNGLAAAAVSFLRQEGMGLFQFGEIANSPGVGWEAFLEGWRGLAQVQVLVPMAASVLTAVLLIVPVAYHPRVLRRATTLDDIEAPKGIIGYAAVSAGIAQVVAIAPAMALVVFGIGGIYRFRTRAGPPKHIYPTISAVVIGLACGMMVFSLAIVLAVLTFALPFWFESHYAVALNVRNLPAHLAADAQEQYRDVLTRRGGKIVSMRAVQTGQFSIVANLPAGVNAAEVEDELRRLPTKEGGDVNWETS